MADSLTRQDFLRGAACAVAAVAAPAHALARPHKAPRAITMWDFSWIERRWSGAGYEDWDRALDELVERGYDAVRIDAFPHVFLGDPKAERTLVPIWNQHDWGSPDIVKVRVLPALIQFIGKCRARGVKVGLSSWFREDVDNIRMKISGPDVLARAWLAVLAEIGRANLLDTILYVDLCNEWPLHLWAPYYAKDAKNDDWSDAPARAFMDRVIRLVRAEHAQVPLFYSLANQDLDTLLSNDISALDAIEHHVWMSQANSDEFYRLIGYDYPLFDGRGYRAVAAKAERQYRERPDYWQAGLRARIDHLAKIGRQLNKPLITTECWSVVDYKDWPMLDWGWIKELCALGTRHASASGQWLAIATSNFCGPQFVGMWRDVAWHRSLTDAIKRGPVDPRLKASTLWARL